MTELDESVGNVCGIKPEVFGAEFLATAPVTDGGGDKDSPAAHGVEEWSGCVIHDDGWFVGLRCSEESETPAAIT